jgi:hypothetical protein
MRKLQKAHSVDGLFVLALFAVFAACVVGVLLAGAGSARRLTELRDASMEQRTAVRYVAARIHAVDTAGAVSVASFGSLTEGKDTLWLTEVLDGVECRTRIYCYEGYLRELFTVAGPGFDPNDFSPRDGEKVLPLAAAEFDLTDGLVTMRLTSGNGAAAESAVALRAVEGGGA